MSEPEEFFDRIQQNWLNGKGICGEGDCDGCLGRDPNHFWSPWFGHGPVPADVVLVGKDPGGNDGPGGETRTNRRGPDPDAENPQIRSSDSISSIYDAGTLGKLEYMIENLKEDGVDVYYTNMKKCSEIKDATERNKDALETCSQYLPDELDMHSGSLSVVVPLGDPAISSVLDVLQIDYPDGQGATGYVKSEQGSEYEIKIHHGNPAVIPAYHPQAAESWISSRDEWDVELLGKQNKNYDDIKKRYYDELEQAIRSTL